MKYTTEEIQALQQKISAAGLTDREKQILAYALGEDSERELDNEELKSVSGGRIRQRGNFAKDLGLIKTRGFGTVSHECPDWNNSACPPDEPPTWKNSASVDLD